MEFGDFMNDYDMMMECAEDCAMENGHPGLKAVCRHIAPPNTENGVMRVLCENFGINAL